MEALRLAGERAKTEAIAARRDRARNRNAKEIGSGNRNGISASSGRESAAVVSELELARAVMTDSLYLAQLAPECFHEVVARVARKTEPELYGLMFPLHRAVGEEDSQQGASRRYPQVAVNDHSGNGRIQWREGGQLEASSLGPSWGRLVHPTHLFHECITAGRLTTAAWYLPLVRDDVAYDAAMRWGGKWRGFGRELALLGGGYCDSVGEHGYWRSLAAQTDTTVAILFCFLFLLFAAAARHAGPDGPLSDEERRRCMPLEMWAMTGKDWSFGLSHALSCVLLSASLSSNQASHDCSAA